MLAPNKNGGDIGLVKYREGLVLKWYKDTLGKWTAGYGHLQRPGEEGMLINQALAEAWLAVDIQAARKVARIQFNQLPIQTQNLLDTLVSVNYQLGGGWTGIHKKTWSLLLVGAYLQAAEEAKRSLWYTQTPVRVQDLVDALTEAYRLEQEYNKL